MVHAVELSTPEKCLIQNKSLAAQPNPPARRSGCPLSGDRFPFQEQYSKTWLTSGKITTTKNNVVQRKAISIHLEPTIIETLASNNDAGADAILFLFIYNSINWSKICSGPKSSDHHRRSPAKA